MTLSIVDEFDLVADRIEAQLHGDVRILCDKDYKGHFHVEVQEIGELGDIDDYGWDACDDEGWFTINAGVFESLEEAKIWLEMNYQ